MLAHRDFVPRQLKASGFLSPAEFEDFEAAVAAAGAWIDTQPGIRVVGVETVVLPNIWVSGETGSADPSLRASGEVSTHWHQFVRVWYER